MININKSISTTNIAAAGSGEKGREQEWRCTCSEVFEPDASAFKKPSIKHP